MSTPPVQVPLQGAVKRGQQETGWKPAEHTQSSVRPTPQAGGRPEGLPSVCGGALGLALRRVSPGWEGEQEETSGGVSPA